MDVSTPQIPVYRATSYYELARELDRVAASLAHPSGDADHGEDVGEGGDKSDGVLGYTYI